MKISTNPFIQNKLSSIQENKLSKPWSNISFTVNGSIAAALALNELNLKKGSSIGIPAYICSSIVNNLEKFGYRTVLIDIEPNLLLSTDKIETLFNSNKIKALIIVEYFGFLTNEIHKISEKIKRKDRIIIVDRCHSPFTGTNFPLVTEYIDAIFFSFRKSIRVTSRGGFILYKQEKKEKKINSNYLLSDLKLHVINNIEFFLNKIPIINLYSNKIFFIRSVLRKFKNKKIDVKKLKLINHLGFFLNKILSNDYLIINIKKMRQQNFLYLLEGLQNIKNDKIDILFNKIDEHQVPQIFPIIDYSENLVKYMRNKGISVYNWPDYEIPSEVIDNPVKFKNSYELNKKIVCVPIHQSLTKQNLNFILKVIEDFLSDKKYSNI